MGTECGGRTVFIGFVHTECEMPKSERPRREACKHWEQGQVGERQVRGWRVIIAVVVDAEACD